MQAFFCLLVNTSLIQNWLKESMTLPPCPLSKINPWHLSIWCVSRATTPPPPPPMRVRTETCSSMLLPPCAEYRVQNLFPSQGVGFFKLKTTVRTFIQSNKKKLLIVLFTDGFSLSKLPDLIFI
jgi:hypothetical protein